MKLISFLGRTQLSSSPSCRVGPVVREQWIRAPVDRSTAGRRQCVCAPTMSTTSSLGTVKTSSSHL